MTTTNPIIIFGSARSFGRTREALTQVIGEDSDIPFVDLNDFDIRPFDYEHRNKDDDFLPLMEKIIAYDTLIIVTPVYWYDMSTQHKIFFDRWTDLLKIRKDLGRKLRGKNLYVIASFGTSLPPALESIFSDICTYLGMNYLGANFIYSGKEDKKLLANNHHHINQAKKILSCE